MSANDDGPRGEQEQGGGTDTPGTTNNGASTFGTRPIPASLVARLAEAADGTRTGQGIFFVARVPKNNPDKKGHDVSLPFKEKAKADKHKQDKGADYEVFGPFETAPDNDPTPPTKHVHSVTVVIADNVTGQQETIPIDPTLFDAIFWGLPAVDKFIVPYYTALGGLEDGQLVRDRVMEADVYLLRHLPGSEYTTVGAAQKLLNPGVQQLVDITDGVPKFVPLI